MSTLTTYLALSPSRSAAEFLRQILALERPLDRTAKRLR